MMEHPGGAEILLDVVGKISMELLSQLIPPSYHIGTDASEVFEEIGRHTTEARELMTKYCVGHLKS